MSTTACIGFALRIESRVWITGLAFASLLLGFGAGAQELPRRKVLIIGIDGTMPTALAVANTPHLDALIAEGAFSDRAITHPVTHSAACWSSMFTGVWGDKHGVNDPGNSFTGNHFDQYPNFLKRLERADSGLNTTAFLRWAPMVAALDGVDLVQAYGSDAAVVTATINHLEQADPDVFYTILLDVDSAGHQFGWGIDVPGYVAAIETADTRVGQILNALTNRPTYAAENWLVFVLSDHGEHDSTLERARVTFHVVWGPEAAPGPMLPVPGIVDVCATVLTHMGLPIDPAWNLDARVEGLPLPPVQYGANLIFNGGAEVNSATNGHTPNRGIAWWWDPDDLTLAGYGSAGEFPSDSSPGPPARGENLFIGGPTTATMSQTIDVSGRAGEIDGLGADFVLSGWFGGTAAQDDQAWLEAQFLDGAGAVLGTAEVGRVSAAERGQITGLWERRTGGPLPPGTRRVQFLLTSEAVSGSADGFADALSFVLTPGGDPPQLFGLRPADTDWLMASGSRSNRLYRLERSTDLLDWMPVLPALPGNGTPVSYRDTNAPPHRAYYRLAITETEAAAPD